jgi:hypothetical protein
MTRFSRRTNPCRAYFGEPSGHPRGVDRVATPMPAQATKAFWTARLSLHEIIGYNARLIQSMR